MDTTVACPRWPVTLNPSLFLLSLIQASLLESVTKGDRLYVEVLQDWALDISLCPVDWRWLWNPELGLNLLLSQTPQSLPHSFPDVFNASPLTMSSPTAPSIPVHTATASPPVTPSGPAQSVFVSFVEKEVMWAPIVQLQLLKAYPPHLHDTLEEAMVILKLVSQDYNGGNITGTEDLLSFFSNFSFDQFITYTFPDFADTPMEADPSS